LAFALAACGEEVLWVIEAEGIFEAANAFFRNVSGSPPMSSECKKLNYLHSFCLP
jgi:hypothetical protein